MNELSTRQYLLIVLFIQFTSKLVTMPTLVFSVAHQDAILAIILCSIIELFIIWIVTRVIVKNPNTNFIALLKNKIGSAGYVVVFFLCVYLLARAIYCFQELYSFFLENLYDELSICVFLVPALFIAIFFSIKGFKVIGRTLEIFIYLIIIGIVIAIASNIEFIDFSTNLPYLENGCANMLSSVMQSLFLFATPCGLLFLVGKVAPSESLEKKTILTSIAGMVVLIMLCFIIYSVFGLSMQYVLFALSEYSQFDPYLLELQRLIWLTAVIDVTKLFLSCICLFGFISSTFNSKPIQYGALTVMSLVIIMFGYYTRFDTIFWFDATKSVLSYCSIGIIFMVILISFVLLRRKNE